MRENPRDLRLMSIHLKAALREFQKAGPRPKKNIQK